MALRAGSVGLRCEAGLGPRRGWGSGRPASPLPVPASGVRRQAPPSPPRAFLPLRPCRPVPPSGGAGRRGSGAAGGVWGGAAGGVRGARVGTGPAGGVRRGVRRRLWTCAGPFSRISPATARVGTSVSVPPSSGRGPGAGGLPGAAPRPAPSSRLRTGADQGNPTV